MAPTKHLLPLLSLLLFSLLAQARLTIHRSDSDAFKTIQNHLKVNGQPQPLETKKNTAQSQSQSRDVLYEWTISNNSSKVLRISRIVLRSQRLAGVLSPAIGRLTELTELSLPNNHLLDRIPPQIVDCKKLEILNLSNNRFSGKVPSQLYSLVRLRILDLSSNQFTGNLDFLRYFPNMEKLSLADNLFTGKIPISLRSFRNLQFFNISGNNFLQGPIPVINGVQYELDSEIRVPKRYIFAENNTTSSNQTTAMAPTGSRDAASSQAPSPSASPTKHKKKNKRKAWGWVIGFLAGAVAGSLSGLVFSVLFKLLLILIKGRPKDSGMAIFSSVIKKAEDLSFLEKDDGLASLQIIGKGGCGEVYKSELPNSNGKWIAIKKVNQPQKDAAELTEEDTKQLNKKMRQIKSEIQTVGQIRHRNLLPLLAHVPRPDCHYLVYEFMKNGSLQDILTEVAEGKRDLDWLVRHKVAVGVAAGLEYLHMGHTPRIIHRDLKPANILLDDDMEARIADFGLAQVVPDADTHVTASHVAGTLGYIAPEYHQTLKFTDKCDIYSFGVMLGVLVIGKLPSDEFFQNTSEMSLVKWMRNVMTSEDPTKAIDPKLMGNDYEEQMLLVLKIACFCTLDDPKERPNSKDVRCMLSQIKHQEKVGNTL